MARWNKTSQKRRALLLCSNDGMKLLLFVSHSGICSRRKALELIKAGKIKVNGSIEKEPSYRLHPERDSVFYNAKRIFLKQCSYILLHKPKGVTSTKKDRFAEKTVMDLLPQKYKGLWPVGRLDKDTTGLLLCTNDGDLSYRLTHPRFRTPKVYIACLDRPLQSGHKTLLERGVALEDGKTAPCSMSLIAPKKIKIILHEGRKRQIKRMFALFGYVIDDLKRIAVGPLTLGSLPEGQWRTLFDSEIAELKKNTPNNGASCNTDFRKSNSISYRQKQRDERLSSPRFIR